MSNYTNSLNPFNNGQGKNKHFQDQLSKVYKAFKAKPLTMKEADVQTNVMRENICRYVKRLVQEGKIAVRRKRKCKVTGYPYVNEYTGNPDLFPKTDQLKLF